MELNKLIFNGETDFPIYQKLYALNVGDVFKVTSEYEEVMEKIVAYCPQNLRFEVFPINPGTSLFTMYGPDHLVVIRKEIITT